MVLTQQLFCVRDLSSKGKSTRRANSGIPRAPHTLEATVFFFCHSRSDLGKVDRHHHHAHTPHLALPLVSLPPLFFFALDVPTTLQVSDECELQNNLPLCVVPKTSRRNLWHGKKCKGGLLSPSLIEWRCLSLQKF